MLFLATLFAIYPLLNRDQRPFSGGWASLAILTAISQELVFSGFLYGRLYRLYPERIWPGFNMPWAVPITAAFFSFSHIWNLQSLPLSFVAFQLAYTFAGGIVHGLLRHWTGSVLWPIAVHVAANWIAVQY